MYYSPYTWNKHLILWDILVNASGKDALVTYQTKRVTGSHTDREFLFTTHSE